MKKNLFQIYKNEKTKGIGAFLRKEPVMINQAEWSKEKTKKVKKKVEKIVKPKKKKTYKLNNKMKIC